MVPLVHQSQHPKQHVVQMILQGSLRHPTERKTKTYTDRQTHRQKLRQNTLHVYKEIRPLHSVHVMWSKNFRKVRNNEWWGAGVVICLERGAGLHMAQLMPLPLTVSCLSKIQIGSTFLVPAYLGSPRKGPLNGCVCKKQRKQN